MNPVHAIHIPACSPFDIQHSTLTPDESASELKSYPGNNIGQLAAPEKARSGQPVGRSWSGRHRLRVLGATT
jgi:hypothetical protein